MENTLEGILTFLRTSVEEGTPLSPGQHLDLAARITALLQSLDEELIAAEMDVNNHVASLIINGTSVAAAKVISRGTPEWEKYLRLKAMRERAAETVRIAKHRSRLSDWDS